MNIEPTRPTVKSPPEQFVGDVWVDVIAAPHEPDIAIFTENRHYCRFPVKVAENSGIPR